MDVLDAQRQLFDSEIAVNDAILTEFTATVSLLQGFGRRIGAVVFALSFFLYYFCFVFNGFDGKRNWKSENDNMKREESL